VEEKKQKSNKNLLPPGRPPPFGNQIINYILESAASSLPLSVPSREVLGQFPEPTSCTERPDTGTMDNASPPTWHASLSSSIPSNRPPYCESRAAESIEVLKSRQRPQNSGRELLGVPEDPNSAGCQGKSPRATPRYPANLRASPMSCPPATTIPPTFTCLADYSSHPPRTHPSRAVPHSV
jgi:hypothetical protein